MRGGILNDALHGEQARYVGESLFRKLQAEEVSRLACPAILFHCTSDGCLARVVSRDGKQPIAVKFCGQELQIIQRSTSRSNNVASSVVVPILFETKPFARAGNELPQSSCTCPGVRDRIESTLDHGKQRELHGHLARFD